MGAHHSPVPMPGLWHGCSMCHVHGMGASLIHYPCNTVNLAPNNVSEVGGNDDGVAAQCSPVPVPRLWQGAPRVCNPKGLFVGVLLG